MSLSNPVAPSRNADASPQAGDDADFLALLSQAQPAAPSTPSPEDQEATLSKIFSAASDRPDLLQQDPAYASGMLHAHVLEQEGQTVDDNKKLALVQAYQSMYGQRPKEAQGGNSAMIAALQAQAAGNSSVGNFARAGANAFAQTGANVLGVVAPGIANELGQRAEEEYNPNMETASGKAGGIVGGIVSTLPAVLVPEAAIPAFAEMGAGQANREVSQRNAQGQNIGAGQRLAYMGEQAAIQAAVGAILGKMGGGGLAQGPGGELTQTLPLQNLIRQFSPDLLKSLQGTDGAVIRPIVQRTLLQMGIGAGANEAAMVAGEIAKSVTGITGPEDKDFLSRVMSQTPESLVSGAAQALPFALHGELGEAGQANRGPVEEVPQSNIEQMGNAGGIPRNVRYASETNPFDEEAPPTTPEAPPTTPEAVQEQQGRQLPADHPLAPQVNELDEMQSKADDLLNRYSNSTEPQRGRLPNETDLATGEVPEEHPLVEALQRVAPAAKGEPIPEHLADDFAVLESHGINAIPVSGDDIPAGFSSPDHPNAVAIDVNNPEESLQAVMAHEASHNWQDANPQKAALLYRLIPDDLRQQYYNDYADRMKAQKGTEYTQDYMAKNGRQEVIATAFQHAVESDSMVQRAWRREGGLWNGIKDAFTRTLNSFSGKGRMLNAVADSMRQGLGIASEGGTAGGEGQQLPHQKQYLEIGHKNADTQSWWKEAGGRIHVSDSPVHEGAAGFESAYDNGEVESRGHIDHTAKEISVLSESENGNGLTVERAREEAGIATGKRLQEKFPDYKVFVSGKGGMIPLEEAESGGRFMLSKLDKMGSVANNKDKLNEETPADEPHLDYTIWDKLKRQTLDDQWPVVKYIREMGTKLGDMSQLSPEAFLRRTAGFRERRYQQDKQGYRTLAGEEIVDKQTGENLTREYVFKPLADAAEKYGEKWADVADHATSIMGAQRTLEKAEIRARKGESLEEPISGIGEARAVAAGEEPTGQHDVDEARAFLLKAGKEPGAAESLEFARRLRLLGNEHVKMAVESGVMSKESAKRMLDDNQFYVNMQRTMENNGALNHADFTGAYAYKFRGSNRDVDNPIRNTLQSLEQIAKKSEINFTKQKILDLAKQVGDNARPVDKEGRNTIPVFENGEKKFYEVDPHVAETINGWGQHVPPAFWGILSMPGKLKAFGTLLRPMFRWNHFRKQTQNRIATSEFAGGIGGIAKSGGMFDPQVKSLLDVLGGTMGHERDYGSSSSDYLNMISKTMDKMTGENKGNSLLALPKKAWDGYQKLGEWSDAANRIAEFKGAYAAAKRRGMSDLDAQNFGTWKARDLMDFSVGGSLVKDLNRIMYMPFLNAELQGINRTFSQIHANPTKILPRLALYGLIPSMIPYLWAKSQGPDAEAKYRDGPLAQRIMFYQYRMGDYQIMSPKGQVQAMCSALWEAFVDKHRGDPSTWWKAMADSGIVPAPIAHPTSVLPLQGVQEAISNYSWFYDRQIIPPDQEGLALDRRHTDGASRIAQFISSAAKKARWEVDPRLIDHVLANDVGTAGIDAELLSNIGDSKKPLAGQALASYADIRLPPGYTSVSVQDAMTAAQRYKDTSSPQYKQVQKALSDSYKATTVADRNKLVDQAVSAADDANSFYEKHGDELLAVGQATDKISQAVAASEEPQGAAARTAWAAANPTQLALLRDKPRLEILDRRVSELRKALVNPRLSASTKDMADRELSRMYSIIVKMTGDTESRANQVNQ